MPRLPLGHPQGMANQPTADRPANRVLAGLDGIRGDLEDLYRDLHRHPELGFREHRTAEEVARRLRECGFEVHEGVGGTGVVGVLAGEGGGGQDGRKGGGPVVLLRADMDALPVREKTGLPYASTATVRNASGETVPVMHACGHDMHVTCLLGAARLLADARDAWEGELVALFQPAEEVGEGASGMVDDGLADRIPHPDVAFAQHVLPYPAGRLGTRAGALLSTSDSLTVTVHGRGGHGSMPQAAVDPVVLAASIVLRLQTVVSRELAPTTTAVLTVGALHAGTAGNVIPDSARIELNVRTYDEDTRAQVLAAVRRIVHAECEASGAPAEPEIERTSHFPATVNDADATERAAAAFEAYFGADRAGPAELLTASEDFSEIPRALGVPFTYWVVGCADPETFEKASARGTFARDVPVNHSARFAPVLQPTLDTGVEALVVAALDRLAASDRAGGRSGG